MKFNREHLEELTLQKNYQDLRNIIDHIIGWIKAGHSISLDTIVYIEVVLSEHDKKINMNKNITDIADKAEITIMTYKMKEYSKLLIEECLKVIYNMDRENSSFEEISKEVKAHFGLK